MTQGSIISISGPIVKAKNLASSGLYDVANVGSSGIIGEIIRLENDIATIQVYEDNSGMKIGEAVESLHKPLSVRLGPGLIGTIYDGIQRPLKLLAERDGAFLKAGVKTYPLDEEKLWEFVPELKINDEIKVGAILGTVKETESVLHKIMVPSYIKGKKLQFIHEADKVNGKSVLAKTELGEEIFLFHDWPVRIPRPSKNRLALTEPLITGLRVIDVFFPISRGGTAAIPGGFGTGKTMTQHAIAKWCDADIIVYIGCGERGNEMTDVLTEFPHLIDPRNGRSLMDRTILIANTSNMPVAAREVSIYTGVTLAEYYRDMGYHVAIMADSTSRWAEALRELSGRMEEMPAEEGFPAYLPTRLAEFYERAGRIETLSGSEGSVSIIGAVSPPGGDFSEPVTQHTRRFIRCFWALDRELANARHYPAIGWLESYSEYALEVKNYWDAINPAWSTLRLNALELLKKEQKLAEIVRLIGPDALPDEKRLILLCADMIKNGFLTQNSFDTIDMYSVPEKQIRILSLLLLFYEKANEVIKNGAPLIKITQMKVRERLIRMKSEIPNDKLELFIDIEESIQKEADELLLIYKGTLQ